nr:HNF protein [synthetic construct]
MAKNISIQDSQVIITGNLDISTELGNVNNSISNAAEAAAKEAAAKEAAAKAIVVTGDKAVNIYTSSQTGSIIVKLLPNLPKDKEACAKAPLDAYNRTLTTLLTPLGDSIRRIQESVTTSGGGRQGRLIGAIIGGVALGVATPAQITAAAALIQAKQNAANILRLKESIAATNEAVHEVTDGLQLAVAVGKMQQFVNDQFNKTAQELDWIKIAQQVGVELNLYLTELTTVFGPQITSPAFNKLTIQAYNLAGGNMDYLLTKLGVGNNQLSSLIGSGLITGNPILYDSAEAAAKEAAAKEAAAKEAAAKEAAAKATPLGCDMLCSKVTETEEEDYNSAVPTRMAHGRLGFDGQYHEKDLDVTTLFGDWVANYPGVGGGSFIDSRVWFSVYGGLKPNSPSDTVQEGKYVIYKRYNDTCPDEQDYQIRMAKSSYKPGRFGGKRIQQAILSIKVSTSLGEDPVLTVPPNTVTMGAEGRILTVGTSHFLYQRGSSYFSPALLYPMTVSNKTATLHSPYTFNAFTRPGSIPCQASARCPNPCVTGVYTDPYPLIFYRNAEAAAKEAAAKEAAAKAFRIAILFLTVVTLAISVASLLYSMGASTPSDLVGIPTRISRAEEKITSTLGSNQDVVDRIYKQVALESPLALLKTEHHHHHHHHKDEL